MAPKDLNLNLERYARQLALPEISVAQQQAQQNARVLVVGAGGLGSPALPYLAAAGVGHITIADDDTVSTSNLHRQTIYKDAQQGQSKAELAAAYIRGLNPEINVECLTERLSAETKLGEYDLLFDGSDNFETKTLLNALSINTSTPLISASVNQWNGQIGLFAGFAKNAPCYHCLFPELPSDARNCNEAGILGTAAGITGIYQAHMALCFLLGLENAAIGTVLTFDMMNFRQSKLTLQKDAACPHCQNAQHDIQTKRETMTPELLPMDELAKREHIIVDVRTAEEIAADPIEGALHMELTTVPARCAELPQDTLLAFVCAGNVRSAQAAEYLAAMGYNTCVLDKFSL